MFILLNAVWFIWEVKYILFWLYLWQLKDYHFGRFIDHFRTHKGKKVIFNFANFVKVILLIMFFVGEATSIYFFSILFLVYFAEAGMFIRGIFTKSVRVPVRTLRMLLMGLVSFCIVLVFLSQTSLMDNYAQASAILWFDVLTPVIISLIVLLSQPFFVMMRNSTLRQARERMNEITALSGLKTVAITGSYGKTSTKEFLATILAKKFRVLKTKEHQNSEIGVANCILQDLKPSHQIFIAEVGAYNKGKVKEVCAMIKPKIGIVTGVNEQHLALFISINNLLSAEGGEELEASLPGDGFLVVNGDNKYCLKLYKKSVRNKKMYGISNKEINVDIWADAITVSKNYVSFMAIDNTKDAAHFEVKVLGKHNVQNLLGAILVAKELGMTLGEISAACKDIMPSQAGMVLKQGKHNIDIVDSSYSANPDGVYADLDYLSVFPKRKVIVMPCLIELGERSFEVHKKIGEKIAEVCDLAVITTKDRFEEIKSGAMNKGMSEKNILLCDNTKDIQAILTLFCKEGDVVLLEGRVPKDVLPSLAA